jgi:hypothetical protein
MFQSRKAVVNIAGMALGIGWILKDLKNIEPVPKAPDFTIEEVRRWNAQIN